MVRGIIIILESPIYNEEKGAHVKAQAALYGQRGGFSCVREGLGKINRTGMI